MSDVRGMGAGREAQEDLTGGDWELRGAAAQATLPSGQQSLPQQPAHRRPGARILWASPTAGAGPLVRRHRCCCACSALRCAALRRRPSRGQICCLRLWRAGSVAGAPEASVDGAAPRRGRGENKNISLCTSSRPRRRRLSSMPSPSAPWVGAAPAPGASPSSAASASASAFASAFAVRYAVAHVTTASTGARAAIKRDAAQTGKALAGKARADEIGRANFTAPGHR